MKDSFENNDPSFKENRVNIMEDSSIVDMYWHKDEQAISYTDQKYGRYLETISYNIVQNNEDTMECKNDTFFKAWNSMPPRRPNVLKVFLGTIIRNISLSLYRSKHAKKRIPSEFVTLLSELDDTVPDVSYEKNATERSDVADMVSEFLKNQPEEKSAMFIMRYWGCDSIEEIAQTFNCSESKVKSSLFYTRKKLKEYLEREGVSL